MAGRKKLPDNELKYPRKGINKGLRAPYNFKPIEERGITYKEPIIIKSFWKEYNMDKVQNMTDEELIQAIDKYLDGFIYRQQKGNKAWDFPVKPDYLAIAPLPEK
jgi:hypothetical protein